MNVQEPMTPMAQAAASMHESFKAMLGAGFTESQACMILGGMLAAGQDLSGNGDKP